MRAGVRGAIRNVLKRAGVDVVPITSLRHPLERRRRLLEALHVDLVIDVGANSGQYGSELREIGYTGQILSFEPLSEPFDTLVRLAHSDPHWRAVQCAIGPTPGDAELNVSANGGASSSFLPMLPEVTKNAPDASFTGTERVTVCRLDEVAGEHVRLASAVFLKADVQGYELHVLESATGILPGVVGLQLEMSLVPLYDGAPNIHAVLEWACDLGFTLVGLEPGFTAVDGRLLQVDGLFGRIGRRP